LVNCCPLQGAEVNKGNNHRNTALHLAAQNGWADLTEILLLHKRIDIDFTDFHANTALHAAAQNGQLGVRTEE
jgi:ankyrin repeat protein